MTSTTAETTVTHAPRAGTPPVISVTGVTRRYRDQVALDNISFDVEPGSITGLLGRNGAGKTTLMRIIAGHEFTTSGHVTIGGARPLENDSVLRQMVFLREDQAYPDVKAVHMLRAASKLYPDWDAELAAELVTDFDLPLGKRIRKLSRGQRSAVGIVIALAARAKVTLLDEPYAGLDAVARQLFYDRLLNDFTEHPRTVLLSTHLIDEASPLMERVVVLDHGRLVLSASTDDLRGSAAAVSGPAVAVAEFTVGRTVLSRRRVGSKESAIVAGPLPEADAARARALRLSLEPLSLQQVVVQAAGQSDASATTTSTERTSA
jgi:ABC-2 type transport system ATP-binding protein